MAYTTEVTHTRTGNTNRAFDVTFPFLEDTHVKVQLGGVSKTKDTHWTISGTVVTFETGVLAAAPASNVVRIYRDTNLDNAQVTFQAGAALRAQDLNSNTNQVLFAAQEFGTLKADDDVDFTVGNKGVLTVNSTTDWVVNSAAINKDNMAANSIGEHQYEDGSIKTIHISDDQINYAKMQDISTANRVLGATSPGTVGEVQIATNMVAGDAITYAKMQDISTANRVLGATSAGGIEEVQVNSDMIADGAVTSSKIASSVVFVPIGCIMYWPHNNLPSGFFECAGQGVPDGNGTIDSITRDFSSLYAIVGGNIPNLRGWFIRVMNPIGGVPAAPHDGNRNILSTQGDLIKTHQHQWLADDQIANQFTNISNYSYDADSRTSGSAKYIETQSIPSSGAMGAETRPHNKALMAIIRGY